MKEIAIKIRLDQVEAKKRAVELTQEISKLQAKQKELNALNKGSAINNKLLATGINNTKIALQQKRAELTKVNGVIKANDNSLGGLRAKNAQLHAQIEKVNTSTKAGQARFKTLSIEIGRNQTQINKLDASMKRYQGNVGNYSSALGGLSGSLRTLAVAFGFTGAIYMFARALKDAFNRIKEFDNEMQNMAGILNTNREDLAEVENVIKRVAAQSIRTSNEVAKLATVLFTLGKTKEEVILMLKPVNNLSIALRATSEETADFLGQTLNAFGRGADSAQEFADIIANMRSSTALDFERMKDALGFLAPTAKALGLTLGDTGAIIGVLQDNGIKAARAGRLMNTSFAKLVNQGLTLDQALEKINNSTNKVATASKLFGARSFTLALVLADNIEKTKRLGSEFDNLSDGSLKKLTDEQLKSLDSQLKILDSTWEEFILGVDSGKGVIAGTASFLVKTLTLAIEGLEVSFAGTSGALEYFYKVAKQIKEDSLADALEGDRKEVNAIAKSLQEKGIPAIEAHERAVKLLRLEYIKLQAFGTDSPESLQKQIDALDAMLTTKSEMVKANADEAAKDARRTENNINKELSKLREKKANAEEADAIKLTKLITAKEAELEAFLRKINENRVNMMEGIQIVANASIEAATESIADQDELAVRILEIQLKSTKDQLHMMTKMIGKKEELTNEEAAHLKHLSDQQFAYEEQLEAKKLEILTGSLSEKQKILDQEYSINLNQLKNRELSADEYNKRLLLLNKTLLVDKIKNIELELKDVESGTVEEYKLKQDLINKKIELDILYAGSSMQNAKDLLEFRKQLDVVSNEELFEIEKQRIIESNEWKLLSEEEQQQALANLKKKYREEDEKEEENTWKKILKTIGQAIQFAEDIVTSYSDLFKYQKEKELSAVGDNAVKREAIEKKYAEKEKKLEIARALINGAAAIQKTIAQWGIPWGLIPAALAAYITKEQIKAIKGAKFKTGGILQGASHEQGGIQLYGKGGYYGEAEGGEPILTKNVSRNPYLLRAASDINVAAGGKPLTSGYRFQEGGLTPTASSSSAINANLVREIVNETIAGVGSIPVTVLENDISRMQRRVSVIERQGDA